MNEHREAPMPLCDAHHHFLDADRFYYPRLCDYPLGTFRNGSYDDYPRSYLPDDFKRDSRRQNVIASVHMECEWDPADPVGETRFISGLAADHGFPNGLVGRAFLDREDVQDVLEGHAAFPLTRGVRHKPKTASSADGMRRNQPGSMDDKIWRDGYARLAAYGFSFDLQAPYWHFRQARDLARDFPNTPLILNHCGLPADRSATALEAWRKELEYLAQEPNVNVKVSGIGVLGAEWTAALNRDIVLNTISIFGVDRCMVASNWPADSLVASSYDAIMNGFREICAELPVDGQRKIFYENAMRIYRIDPSTVVRTSEQSATDI